MEQTSPNDDYSGGGLLDELEALLDLPQEDRERRLMVLPKNRQQQLCRLLLVAGDDAGMMGFLAEPPQLVRDAVDDAQDRAAETAAIPPNIGRFRILSKLGEGGMGIVYLAEQQQPRRRVALKSIKPGFDTAEVLARFDGERQTLARMEHPHIAKVFDAGVDDRGRPYFAMEYVDGQPITKFADQHKLTIRRRLELFLQACDAIAHAHTKATIHRDIKGGNVLAYMADGKPNAKVIDFGIAKALAGDRLADRSVHTGLGNAIGTYESMSPEQAGGSADIDTRTDIYSLGVLLYELLSGSKPFDSGAFDKAADNEIRRIIREVEPPKPSTRLSNLRGEAADAASAAASARQERTESLAKQLRNELEWIPLMAIRKDPDRRYGSVRQMIDDVENYFTGRPLVAGPESRLYRFKKTVGRHRSRIAVTAGFIVLVAIAIGAYINGVRRERENTQAEAKRAHLSAADARASEAKATARALEESRLLSRGCITTAEQLAHDDDPAAAVLYLVKSLEYGAGGKSTDANTRQRIAEAFASTARVMRPPPDLDVPALGLSKGRRLQIHTGNLTAENPYRMNLDILDNTTGRHLAGPFVSEQGVTRAYFSDDGATVIALTRSMFGLDSALAWEVASGSPVDLRPKSHRGDAHLITVSPDGKLSLLTDKDGNSPQVVDNEEVLADTPIHETAQIVRAVFSPDGSLLFTVNRAGACRIWHLDGDNTPKSVSVNADTVPNFTTFDAADRKLATWSGNEVSIWDATTGTAVGVPLKHPALVRSAAFSSLGDELVTLCADLCVRTWDSDAIDSIPTEVVGRDIGDIQRIGYAHDDTDLVGIGYAGTRILQPRHLRTARTKAAKTSVDFVAFDGSSHRVIAWDHDLNKYLWDPGSTKHPALIPKPVLRGDADVKFSRDGRMVLVAQTGKPLLLWNSASQRWIDLAGPHPAPFPPAVLAFDLDGKRVISAALVPAAVSGMWDAAKGSHIRDFSLDDGIFVADPNLHRAVAFLGGKTLALLDLETDRPAVTLDIPITITSRMAFNDSGTLLAATDGLGKRFTILNTTTDQQVFQSPDQTRSIDMLAFSPDGTKLAIEAGLTVRVWDVSHPEKPSPDITLFQKPSRLLFSPDNRLLVVDDGQLIRFHDPVEGQEIGVGVHSPGAVTACAFDPTGNSIVFGTGNGWIRKIDFASDHRDLKTIKSLAEILACRQLNEDGMLTPLTRAEIDARLDACRNEPDLNP